MCSSDLDQIYVLNQSSDFFVFNADLIGEDESIGRIQYNEEIIEVLAVPTPGTPNPGSSGEFLFVRGDLDFDLDVDQDDAILLTNHFFGNPIDTQCADRLDVDDNGFINIQDLNFMIQALESPGVTIPAPYPLPGTDPTPDTLECEGL